MLIDALGGVAWMKGLPADPGDAEFERRRELDPAGPYGFIALRLAPWLQRHRRRRSRVLPIASLHRQGPPQWVALAERYAVFAWCAGFRDIGPLPWQ